MSELRKDYIFDKWVIISEKRGKRPNEFKKPKQKEKIPKDCPFCQGNEHLTGKEHFRLEYNKKWTVRCFENIFSAVSPNNKGKIKTRGILTSGPAYGHAEVIVESPFHNKQLEDLPAQHIKDVLEIYAQRIQYFTKDKNINYVSVFKNHNKEAGASIRHSHSQLIAYNQVPRHIKAEIDALKKYKGCPYCKILRKEAKSKRMCFNSKNFVAFAPFASQYNYEVFIFPKRHVRSIIDLRQREFLELSIVLRKILIKLKTIDAPYNLYMHGAHHHENMHFHMTIKPRLNIFAGFELETGTIINTVPPEKAAQFYRK